MNIIRTFITKYKQNIKVRNEACDSLILQIDAAIQEVNKLFSNKISFIEPNEANEWCRRNATLISRLKERNISEYRKASHYKSLQEKQDSIFYIQNNLPQQISRHNNQVAETRVQNAYVLLGDVEGHKLDKQQMICIVKEAHNHLVIAGAGTGKTTTIVGMIKYLLKSGKYKPEDILVLSFTNASASEMSQRINQETGCKIDASTFHKLGLNIITKVNGIEPKITQINLRKFVKLQLQQNMQSGQYLSLLSTYLLFNRIVAKSEFEFSTKAEYEEYLKLNPPTTIKNETVKSYGEMDIANFLVKNSIKYIYEHPYKVDTRTDEYAEYRPDFYLPDYEIYIEYFGVDRNGEVPSYFNGKNGMTATQTYRTAMEWKRDIHNANNTTMIECYAYEKLEGTLLDNLQSKLVEHSVELKPQTTEELWSRVSAEGDTVLDGVVDLFQTVISLMKSNGYNIDKVRQLNVGGSNMVNNNLLLLLLKPIYNAYCIYLKEHDEIDFSDMIIMATQYVDQGKYVNPYKYVIVDEYQDISKARYLLLNSLRKSSDYNLFCVGDDWQSIYRFAGSDIGYILNFEKYWGRTEISKIETTYRFTQKLIEISGSFVMRNPAQIKKSIKGKLDTESFPLGEINGYTDRIAVEFMVKRLDDLPKGSSVFFIGRYSFDVNILEEHELLECHYDNVSCDTLVKYYKRPDLKMTFITAHRSKGLQADYVFIINNKKSRMGFPSKIQDAAILNLLLENSDQFPYAEERRLFYVALTRAKKKVFLVTLKDKESEFALELKQRYADELKKERAACPLCGGYLLKRSGKYGEFLGCSNYKEKGCRYTRDIKKS